MNQPSAETHGVPKQATGGERLAFIELLRVSAMLLVIFAHLVAQQADRLDVALFPVEFIRRYIVEPLAITQDFVSLVLIGVAASISYAFIERPFNAMARRLGAARLPPAAQQAVAASTP